MTESPPSPQAGIAQRGFAETWGALNAAVSSLAISAAMGTLVFAPLGPSAMAKGVAASMIAAIVGGLVAALATSTPLSVSSPRAATSVVLAGFVASVHRTRPDLPVDAVIALTGLMVITAGLLQMSAAAVRMGRLVRFVPFPVIAGFTHGVALLLLLVYVPVLCGASRTPALAWPAQPISWSAVALGVATLAAAFVSQRVAPRVPALFVALVAGLASQWALARGVAGFDAGEVIRPADLGGVPAPFGPWSSLPPALREPVIVGQLISFAIAAACVTSIDSLIGLMGTESRFGIRSRPDRDLFAQGLGNAVSGAFGGIAISYSTVQATVAHSGGARTRWTGPLSALLLAGMAFAARTWIDSVALAIVGGLMVFVATRLADPWGFTLMGSVMREGMRSQSALRAAFLTYLLVALSIVLLDMISALAIGVTVAAASFVRTLNQHVVRRVTLGPALRSRRLFPPRITRLLAERLRSVAVVELQGPLFFGTAERLLEEIAGLPPAIHYVVFDMRRVQAIDATANAVLVRLHARLRAEGRQIAISGRPAGLGALDGKLPPAFADRDRAIEWVEERLLVDEDLTESGTAVPRAAFVEYAGLDEAQGRVLLEATEETRLLAGDPVFRSGDGSDYLYFLLVGRVSIVHGAGASALRVVTLLPGNVFGHVSFIDGQVRSASAVCDTDCVVLGLHRTSIARLGREAPEVLTRLLERLAVDLAHRLRATDRLLRESQ